MKFKLLKASSLRFEDEVELNSLKELLSFIKGTKKDCLIGSEMASEKNPDEVIITIYDGYIE